MTQQKVCINANYKFQPNILFHFGNIDRTCKDTEFQCGSGECIVSSWRCDGDADCNDLSDESNCPKSTCSPLTEFTCGDGRCIDIKWRCDGSLDCSDDSDEKVSNLFSIFCWIQ